MGLGLTTLVGTYLVLLNYSIALWAIPWALIGSVASLLMVGLSMRKNDRTLKLNTMPNLVMISVGFIITCILILSPMIKGGLTFTVLRGNGSDTFNYLTMAGYLQHEPYFWMKSANLQMLIDKHPSYAWARELLMTRWSTAMLLGWTSQLSHVPLYRFEYGFTALFFLMTYGCIYCLAALLSLKTRYAVLCAIALCTGFWAQHLLDMRAMSQMSATPLMLLLTIFLIQIEENKSTPRLQLFLGVIFAAIGVLYIEMLALIFLSLAIFSLMLFFYRRNTLIEIIKKYIFAIILFVIIIAPISYEYLLRYLAFQTMIALSLKNTWHQAYFAWLYLNPLFGFWGFSYIATTKIWQLSLMGLSIGLSSLLLLAMLHIMTSGKKISSACILIVACIIALTIEFTILYCQGQLWAAGKAFSFYYPFIVLVVAVFALELLPKLRISSLLISTSKYLVITWLVIQCGLGFYRISAATSEQPFPTYLTYHGDYLQHDWNIDSLTKVLEEKNARSVGLLLPNHWTAEYFAFVWGWDRKVINSNGIVDRGNHLDRYLAIAWDWQALKNKMNAAPDNKQTIYYQTVERAPEYLIVTADNHLLRKCAILSRNKEFALIKTPSNWKK